MFFIYFDIIIMRFERETRYYRFWTQVDLLGDYTVVIVHGQKNTRKGKVIVKYARCENHALEITAKLIHTRIKRNYQLVAIE